MKRDTKWTRNGNVEEAERGILSWAPGRARLVQGSRMTETPRMSKPQEYTKVARDMSHIPPREGGIPTRPYPRGLSRKR